VYNSDLWVEIRRIFMDRLPEVIVNLQGTRHSEPRSMFKEEDLKRRFGVWTKRYVEVREAVGMTLRQKTGEGKELRGEYPADKFGQACEM
jgi:hypothetical protein